MANFNGTTASSGAKIKQGKEKALRKFKDGRVSEVIIKF